MSGSVRPALLAAHGADGEFQRDFLSRHSRQITCHGATERDGIPLGVPPRRGGDLPPGALGQLIEVQNGSSGKTVQAVVRSERTVEVLLR